MVSFQRMKDELNDVENQVSCVFLPLMLFLEDMRKIKTRYFHFFSALCTKSSVKSQQSQLFFMFTCIFNLSSKTARNCNLKWLCIFLTIDAGYLQCSQQHDFYFCRFWWSFLDWVGQVVWQFLRLLSLSSSCLVWGLGMGSRGLKAKELPQETLFKEPARLRRWHFHWQ